MRLPPDVRPTPQPDSARMRQARLLRGLAPASQVVVMVALFVLWKQWNWPFGKALEACLVAGVAVYTLLIGAALLLMVLARVRPATLLAAPALRLVCVAIYAVMRWVKGAGIFQSAGVLLVLYFAAWVLVRRIEARARRRFGW